MEEVPGRPNGPTKAALKTEGWCFAVIFLVPPAFFWPNLHSGGVILPLDLLHNVAPFSNSVPSLLKEVHNPHLSDIVTIYYEWLDMFRTSGGIVPLWNPYSFCGSPLLANAQNGLLFPVTWLFRFLPFGLASILAAMAKMWFCGLFAFFFYRNVRFHHMSALLGSIGFMLCGHMIVWFGYPTSFPLISLPFLFWALERFLNRPALRNLAWISIGFGLLFIGGQPQTGFIIALAATVYFVVRSIGKIEIRARLLLGFAVSAVLGCCLAAPQIVPFLEYLGQSAAGRLRVTFGWKYYPWFTLASWIMPRFFGDFRAANFWGFSSMLGEAIYIGAIPAALAILGVTSAKKDTHYGATLAVFLLGCSGLYLAPVVHLYSMVPVLANIDNNKLIVLVAFGLISFAVQGLDFLFADRIDRRGVFVRWCIAVAAWLVLLTAAFLYFREALTALTLTTFEAREAAWLLAFLAAAVVVLWLWKNHRLGAREVGGLLLLMTAGDMFRVWVYYYPSYPEAYLKPESKAVAYLQKTAGIDRILGLSGMLPPETSVLFRLQDARGYDGMTPYTYYQILEKIEPGIHDLWSKLQARLLWTAGRPDPGTWTHSTLFYRSLEKYLATKDPKIVAALQRIDYWSSDISSLKRMSILSLLGIKYLVSPRGHAEPARAGLRLAHSSDADVWENPLALPRAFVATNPMFVEDDQAALQTVSAPEFPFDRTAVVTMNGRPLPAGAGANGRPATLLPARLLRYESEDVEIATDSPDGGWLILGDLFYPGWKATIDGSPTAIFPGNFMLRAVYLSPGSHNVRFAYRPRSFRLGLLMGLAAGLALIAVSFWK